MRENVGWQGFRRRVLQLVEAIPPGRVATYGQIAALAGFPRRARQVGRVLAESGQQQPAAPEIPWHRVLNAQGRISERGQTSVVKKAGRGKSRVRPGQAEQEQARRLRREGVEVREGRVRLALWRWNPELATPWPAGFLPGDDPNE